MTLTDLRSLELPLPHSRGTVVEMITEHSHAELSRDLDRICSTVSARDQQYAMIAPTPSGEYQLIAAFTPEEVRAYYTKRKALFRYDGGETRWYDLHARWYQLIDTECDLTALETGTRMHKRAISLQPVWTDGIMGEIGCSEPEGAERAIHPEALRQTTRLLNTFDDAWQSGDVDGMLAAIEDNTCSAVRILDLDGGQGHRVVARTKAELRNAWTAHEMGRVLQLERLHHTVTNTYVFAHYKLLVERPDGTALRETARMLPLGPSRRFIGELSYSLESRL